MSKDILWKHFKKNYIDQYSSLDSIIDIFRLLPITNAKVERSCSAVKQIKTDNRNQLSTEMLNNLMTISLEGLVLPNFNSEKAVAKFFDEKPRRPSTESDVMRVGLEFPIH